jgi:hypothetical protein
MSFDPEQVEESSSELRDEETRMTKKPEKKGLPDGPKDNPEKNGSQEEVKGFDEDELLNKSVYENYYSGASVEESKQMINYLNTARQKNNEVELLRFVTGRTDRKPGTNPSNLVQHRSDLVERFSVGSMTDPDENTQYMSEASAAHDLIDYLAAEAKQAINRKEQEGSSDTGSDEDSEPENEKKEDGQEESESEKESPDTEQEEPDSEEEDPDQQQEEPDTEEGPDEEPDVPDPEQLQDEPEELKKARAKFLKAQRIHTSILRGETAQKLMTWIPGVDRRSVMHEGEELFFDGENAERNLGILQNNYADKLDTYRGEKMEDFIANHLNNIPEHQKEEAITEFARNLQSAQQQNRNEAFQALDESFDDSSFREFWRRDDVWWTRMGLSGAGLTASLAGSAATGGAGYMTWRTAMGTLSGYTMTEGYLEQTDNSLLDWISRRSAISDIASGLDEGANSEDIRNAIVEQFSEGYADEDNQNAELKRELNRMRMLANELGTSVDEAVAGGNELTAQIVQEMQDMEHEIVANNAVEAMQDDSENIQDLENEEVYQDMMDTLRANENFMMSRMVEEGSQERSRKMQRKIGGALVGAGFGWLIGSGRMGQMLRDGAEGIGDAWGGIQDWWGGETPPADGPDMSELPPEMQPQPEVDTIFDVEITDWDGQEVYGDEDKARSFIEATGDIKSQMEELNAFDVTGGQGSPLNNLEAAENLQDFLGNDIANDLAERLDGYRPEDIKESLVVHPGETLSVTKEGNLILEQTSGETELLYNGAQDQVNADVLKDDLFGDFDDTSGPANPDTPAGAQGDVSAEEVEAVDPADPVNAPVDDFKVPEQIDSISAGSSPANGITKGAFHSYTEALDDPTYNPEYISDLQIPDGIEDDQFTQHIRELNELDQPLQNLTDIAENEPEKYRSLQALFDGYAEANMTPPGVDVSESADLEGLYDVVQQEIDDNAPAPEPPTADGGGSVDPSGPDNTASDSANQTGGEITGEGRSADIEYESNTEQSPEASGGEPTEGSGEIEDVSNGDEAVNTGDAVTAEEMQSIIDASDTGLGTYPRDLAANLAISDAENLSVSQDELTNLIDTLPPQSEFSSLTGAVQQMEPSQLEHLYQIMEYHEENPGLVQINTLPDMQSEVSPLMDFVSEQYKNATGSESIQAQIGQ